MEVGEALITQALVFHPPRGQREQSGWRNPFALLCTLDLFFPCPTHTHSRSTRKSNSYMVYLTEQTATKYGGQPTRSDTSLGTKPSIRW